LLEKSSKAFREANVQCVNSCSIYSTKGQFKRHDGLVEGHAYSIKNFSPEISLDGKTYHLIRLRNPWGKHEWNGRWSDNDPVWKRQELHEQFSDQLSVYDGSFWMDWIDFVRIFDHVQALPIWNNTSRKLTRSQMVGIWLPGQGGSGQGSMEAAMCWTNNPQCSFEVKREVAGTDDCSGSPDRVILATVYQYDVLFGQPGKRTHETSEFAPIGIQIWSIEKPGERLKKPVARLLIRSSPYKRGRSVSLNLNDLPPGKYIAVPTILTPATTPNSFVFVLQSSTDLRMKPLQAFNMTELAKPGRPRMIDAMLTPAANHCGFFSEGYKIFQDAIFSHIAAKRRATFGGHNWTKLRTAHRLTKELQRQHVISRYRNKLEDSSKEPLIGLEHIHQLPPDDGVAEPTRVEKTLHIDLMTITPASPGKSQTEDALFAQFAKQSVILFRRSGPPNIAKPALNVLWRLAIMPPGDLKFYIQNVLIESSAPSAIPNLIIA